MNRVKIVTDSTAYLTEEIIKKYDISVVPLTVNFDGCSFPENNIKDYHEFFQELRSSKKKFSTTSQPAIGEFVETFRRLTEDGSQVISIHISGQMSGTVQSARTAAAMLPDRDISVVDSLYTISALYYLAWEAAKMAMAGDSKELILEQIEQMREKSRLFFLVDDLEFLHRGGRIGGAAAVFGTLLQIKPILHIENGIIDVFRKVRTREKAVMFMMDELDALLEGRDISRVKVGTIHVDNLTGAKNLQEILVHRWPELKPDMFSVGPVIGSHVGPGSIGVIVTEV